MGPTSDVDVKLGNARWRVSCRDTRGGDTLASVKYLRQCVVKLWRTGLFGDDGAWFGIARPGEDCRGKMSVASTVGQLAGSGSVLM